MSAPEWCRVVGGTDAGVHLVNHLECCITNDWLSSILALEGLVIGGHECLRAQRSKIWNYLDSEVLSFHSLRNLLLELYSSSDICQEVSKLGVLEHLARHTIQLQRKWLLVLGRSEATDRLDVRLQEVDVGTFWNEEGTNLVVRFISIQVREGRLSLVGLGDSTIGHLYDERAWIRTVDGKGDATTEFLNTGISIAAESERALYAIAVDVVAPLGVTTGLVVITDGTIFLVVAGATILVVAENECKVLVGVGGIGIDVQIENRVPSLAIGNLIIL